MRGGGGCPVVVPPTPIVAVSKLYRLEDDAVVKFVGLELVLMGRGGGDSCC